jgi:hypothetical protein
MKTNKTNKTNKNRRISVNKITSQIRRYCVPSIKANPEYNRGYSDAVEKLYGIIEERKINKE